MQTKIHHRKSTSIPGMILGEDGNPKWIYNFDDKTGKGIIPDDQFTDPWEMEGAGYNKFKSSNNAVVGHENLVVTRRETDTQITISSVLSSELYREAAAKHPDNAVLQKLYKTAGFCNRYHQRYQIRSRRSSETDQ